MPSLLAEELVGRSEISPKIAVVISFGLYPVSTLCS